jgi:hypothetical protein
MDNPPTIYDYADSLQANAERLEFTATVDGAGAKLIRDSEVRKILRRSAELVRGVAILGRAKNHAAIGLLARAIVESLVLLLWVEISEENAIHQSNAGLAELKRIARINLESGILKVWNRDTGQNATSDFLKSDTFKDLPKSKKITDQAKEADVQHIYDVLYRFLSMSTHGHDFGASPENAEERTLGDLQAVGALSMAIGHVGLRWLLHRQRTDNESLRKILGLNDEGP